MTDQPPQTEQPFGPEPGAIEQVSEPILDRPEGDVPEVVEITGPLGQNQVQEREPTEEELAAYHAEVAEVERRSIEEAEAQKERVPPWSEVQAKIMDRVPLTAVERQVAESAQVFLPADYPTTAAPVEVEKIEPEVGPSMFDQLAELSVEERLERLERLQAAEAQTFRNVVAELGRANGREAQLMEIIDGGTPELAVPQL